MTFKHMGVDDFAPPIVDLFRKRGVKVEMTYPMNTGGTTVFPEYAQSHATARKDVED